MGKNKTNTFKKINYHLKSKQIDEKLELLNEIPTNNSAGIYVVEPEYIRTDIGEPEVPVDLTLNGSSGRDTSGIFDYGISLMQDPPGDASYFLGPIVSIYDSDTNSTQIGYVRESDRHMVNLGRVAGTLDTWDGSSGFTSYGQLTAEQVSWYRTQYSSNKVADYPVFYTGLSRTQNNLLQTFDNFGRVVAQILNLPKESYQIPNSKQFSSPIPPGGLNWRAIGGEPSNFNVFYYDSNYPQQQTDYLIQRGQSNNFNSYLNGSNYEPATSVQVNRLTGSDSGLVEVRINGILQLRWLNIYNASDPMSDWIVAVGNLTNINSSPMTVQGTRNVTNTRVPPVMGPFDKNLLPNIINAAKKFFGALGKALGEIPNGLKTAIQNIAKLLAPAQSLTYMGYLAAQSGKVDYTKDSPLPVPLSPPAAQKYSDAISEYLNSKNINDPSKMTQKEFADYNVWMYETSTETGKKNSEENPEAYLTFYKLS